MQTFTDSEGRGWKLTITIDTVRRVQSLAGVNLVNIAEADEGQQPLMTRLELDLVLLVDVIWAIVEPQASAAGITSEQFGQALGGEAIASAHDAFWRELADFFRQLRRGDQARAIERQIDLVQAGATAAEQRIDAIDIDGLVEQALGSSSGAPPASSASTPAR